MTLSATCPRLTGTGRATVARIGCGLPGWGDYALLYATALDADGRLTATVAATDPALLAPDLGLHQPLPHAPTHGERRPLLQYAAAASAPQGSEPAAAYQRRLATQVLRTGHAARVAGAFAYCHDLPAAVWDVEDVQETVLSTEKHGAGYAGHHLVRIGRLLSVTAKAG